jgi:putative Mg2+ transporter-C (MgtC) family protein
MNPIGDLDLLQRLLAAALLGAIVGLERELRHKTAGLRTNVLITVGAALFTIMSIELTKDMGDPSRIAAQIVSGVGFLGAGAIIRTTSGIQGLTTAATVWVNAAIGVAVGGGSYRLAAMGTFVTLGVLLLLHPVEQWMEKRQWESHGLDRRQPPGA